MATIVYLDVEDEITTAAARIRTANAPRVGIVIPFGSRVATSRINFRLLAREAVDAGRRLDVVAPDASARALAASAGLPVFASVGEYEAALDAGGQLDALPAQAPPTATSHASPRGAAVAPVPAAKPGATRGTPKRMATPIEAPAPEATAIAAGSLSSAGSDPASRDVAVTPSTRHRGIRRAALALVLLLVVALGAGGAAAAVMLPSADITVTPVLEPVSPIALTVRADTTATAVDAGALVIPAVSVAVPATVQGDFPVTGVSVQQTSATGRVTFDSINTVNAMPIARGTRVSTSDGITFATTDSVTVPRATVPGGGSTITHGTASVGVTAVSAGPKGNVAAGAIDQVPSSLAALQVSVSNPSPTAGGTRTELPKIAAADVAAAKDKLSKDVAAQVATSVADPTLAPQGTTLYPDTLKAGAATFTPDPAGLEGKVLKAGQTTFALQADETATVTAVDETVLKAIGESAVRAAVTSGAQIVENSIEVTTSEGTVGEDGTVSYTITGAALQHRPLDPNALKAAVLGKPEADARAALARYGQVAVTLWPFWVDAVPTNGDRVTLTVATPVAPAATPTPAPTATPRATKASAAPKAGSPSPVESAPSASPVPSG